MSDDPALYRIYLCPKGIPELGVRPGDAIVQYTYGMRWVLWREQSYDHGVILNHALQGKLVDVTHDDALSSFRSRVQPVVPPLPVVTESPVASSPPSPQRRYPGYRRHLKILK